MLGSQCICVLVWGRASKATVVCISCFFGVIMLLTCVQKAQPADGFNACGRLMCAWVLACDSKREGDRIKHVRMCAGVFRQMTPYTPLLPLQIQPATPPPCICPPANPSSPLTSPPHPAQACTQCSHRAWPVISWQRISEWMRLVKASLKLYFGWMMAKYCKATLLVPKGGTGVGTWRMAVHTVWN